MRLSLVGGLAGFLIAGSVAVDGWLPGGGYLPGVLGTALAYIAFALVFASFFWVLYVLNGHQLGAVPFSRVRPVIRAVPWWLWLIAGVLFALCIVNFSFTIGAMQAA